MQAGRGVGWQNRNGFLGNDWPAVDTLIDEVDGTAGDLDSIIQSLLPSLQSRERRKQRGVDIHDSTSKGAQEFAFENAHEPRHDDQINLGVAQPLDVKPFSIVIKFGTEFSGRDILGRNATFFSLGQDPGVPDVA